jgi:hypothetical protein
MYHAFDDGVSLGVVDCDGIRFWEHGRNISCGVGTRLETVFVPTGTAKTVVAVRRVKAVKRGAVNFMLSAWT